MSQAENMPSTPRPLRALTMFDHVPGGCILQPVTDDDSAPHLRAGEFAIVDTTDTEPQHGEVYLVRFISGAAGGIRLRKFAIFSR